MFEKIVVAIFLQLIDQLMSWGYLTGEEALHVRSRVQQAKAYKETVDKPGNTREERRRAEDDFFS